MRPPLFYKKGARAASVRAVRAVLARGRRVRARLGLDKLGRDAPLQLVAVEALLVVGRLERAEDGVRRVQLRGEGRRRRGAGAEGIDDKAVRRTNAGIDVDVCAVVDEAGRESRVARGSGRR